VQASDGGAMAKHFAIARIFGLKNASLFLLVGCRFDPITRFFRIRFQVMDKTRVLWALFRIPPKKRDFSA
jgi:hypothetical protein